MVNGLLSALWARVVYDRWPWFRGCMRGNDFFGERHVYLSDVIHYRFFEICCGNKGYICAELMVDLGIVCFR